MQRIHLNKAISSTLHMVNLLQLSFEFGSEYIQRAKLQFSLYFAHLAFPSFDLVYPRLVRLKLLENIWCVLFFSGGSRNCSDTGVTGSQVDCLVPAM
jgi:hypothetical protein